MSHFAGFRIATWNPFADNLFVAISIRFFAQFFLNLLIQVHHRSCMTVDFMNGIQVWLSKLREEAKLRPKLVEPNGDATDSVLEHTSVILLSRLFPSLDPDFQLRDFELAYAEIWLRT